MYRRLFDLFLAIILLVPFWGVIRSGSFRSKVKYFFLVLVSFSIWGFYMSYDGCVLIFLLSEFFILLMFLILYLSNATLFTIHRVLPINFSIFLFVGLCFFLLFSPISRSGYSGVWFNYLESALDVVSSDFFIFFQFFIVDNCLLTAYCALILSFFIIFFIAFYFQLKKIQQNLDKAPRGFEILRKQNMMKQARHKAQVRVFKI